MWINIALVAFGGAIGSVLRYAIALSMRGISDGAFPWAILSVNVSGCLLIGIVGGLLPAGDPARDMWRIVLMVGLLGGFTTFSSFGWDTIMLVKDGRTTWAIINVLGNNVAGLTAVWLGLSLASRPGIG